MRFSLQLGSPQNSGNPLNSFDEGVEFSFRNLNSSINREWIPLMFYATMSPIEKNRASAINVGEAFEQVNIRGYNVSYVIGSNNASETIQANLSICGSEIVQSSGLFNHIQFRWLQTVTQSGNRNRDRVLLDDVTVSAYLTQQLERDVFADDFDNQTTLK